MARNKNKLLVFFMLMDFIFTYIGIVKFGFIEEGNPILVWIFELPFLYGFVIRFIYCFILYLLFQYIYKSNYKYYNLVINFSLIVNITVLVMHLNWTRLLLIEILA